MAARLVKLVKDIDVGTFLDVPDGYVDVLGVRGMAEFTALLSRGW